MVGSVDNCTEYQLRGYVRQDQAWATANSTVAISAAAGAITDCAGAPFPAFSASTSLPNKYAYFSALQQLAPLGQASLF